MKKIFLTLMSAGLLAGSLSVVPETSAEAASWRYHNRHHERVCRVVVRKKVVWRHHHRVVVRYNVRKCHWV